MSKYIISIGRTTLTAVAALAMTFGLVSHQNAEASRVVPRSAAVAVSSVQSAPVTAAQTFTVAKATPKRLGAFSYALKQHYEPYSYGHAGPSSWDCSGLVMRSYASVGISLPRTTGGMLGSSKLVRVSASYAYDHKGTLAFHGTGHVELVSSYKYMYGAHHSGTSVSYRAWYDRSVWKFYRVVGAS